MSRCTIGVLAAPVIDVDSAAVIPPGIRLDRYCNFKNGYFSRVIYPRLSPTWVVPARDPGALGTAFQTIPKSRGFVR